MVDRRQPAATQASRVTYLAAFWGGTVVSRRPRIFLLTAPHTSLIQHRPSKGQDAHSLLVQDMSDAAMKVDPDYYNRRLLETDLRVDQSRRAAATGAGGAHAAPSSWGAGGGGGGGGIGGSGGLPDLPDYLVRQHSLLGLYLSLNPGDEGDSGNICDCSTLNETPARTKTVRKCRCQTKRWHG